ncbi:MAG: stage V sporulation protein AD [Oscillospiraceae bacterium]|nr:stage V sporulation protein AD [Oscillospiraceae bacterium]
MSNKIGNGTIIFDNPIYIISYASVGSKKEGDGPLAGYIDFICDDTTFGEKTWEKSESRIQKHAVEKSLLKADISVRDIDFIIAGDLLNQCIGSTYGSKDMDIPFIGLYGACSTMAESLAIGSVFLTNDSFENICCVTSSHFCSAERQFRFPLEYGGQRTPTSQWTVTGGGSVILSNNPKDIEEGIVIKAIKIGKIKDLGIKDANNMGAAMAPSAAYTIKEYLDDTLTKPSDYDLILTGDLGEVGSGLLKKLLERENIDISKNHNDCGLMVYDLDKQDVNAGGSGCGCSAITLTSYILKKMEEGVYKNILFVGTGALLSTTSIQQGDTIPGISHLIHISKSNIVV